MCTLSSYDNMFLRLSSVGVCIRFFNSILHCSVLVFRISLVWFGTLFGLAFSGLVIRLFDYAIQNNLVIRLFIFHGEKINIIENEK